MADLGATDAAAVGDPALVFSLAHEPDRKLGRTLGVNLGTACGSVWGRSEAAGLTQIIEALEVLQRSGWRVKLFSVWAPDTRVLHGVADRLGLARSSVVTEYRSGSRFMRQVRECDVFLGMKLHAQVLSMCAGVPTVAIEYQPKTAEVMSSINTHAPLRFDAATRHSIVDAVTRARDEAALDQLEQWQGCRAGAGHFLDYVTTIGGDARGVARWIRRA
jgi:polysaccharide pyruvyl transferase WcaK-like protein